MTVEQLNEIIDLDIKIRDTEKLLQRATNNKAEWIDFNYGNGGNSSLVCKDVSEIEIVRTLLIAYHTKNLTELKKKFSEL